mmetsp:Transcript_23420/g.54511  ORF Transcript_23420/g.54511 Transcript_23420/m.54511 type:complete len:899 (-) Transcript_23420:508-3204(-)
MYDKVTVLRVSTRSVGVMAGPRKLALFLLLLPHCALGNFCTSNQWVEESCPYAGDGVCDAPTYCSSGSDCFDCDPCQASIAGYGGCGHCVAIDGCSWCRSSGLCRSTVVQSLVLASGAPYAPCDSGWETDTCEASNHVVAGQHFDDPAAEHQRWYLDAINVAEAWALGYTGDGVNIFFHDDALDIAHSDFKDKYNSAGSPEGHDPKPTDYAKDQHGTAVVGYAAAAANNSVCGVGVAFGSTVSFAKFSEPVSSVFGTGVDNNVNHVHSNSWGLDACPAPAPDAAAPSTQAYNVVGAGGNCPFNSLATGSPCDSQGGCGSMDWSGNTITGTCIAAIKTYCNSNLGDGQGLYDPACADHWDLWIDCQHKGLGIAETAYLRNGVTNGRNGKGIVYVFAAGNEFTEGDNVNFEGWLNSIYTISVAATALDGEHSYYSSAGAPVHISAPGGETGNGKMPTAEPSSTVTDGCKDGGQGTSYATPVVSGVVALMLQANNNLGWRDVQEILTRSAATIDAGHVSWVTNGAGLKHSDLYGFGLIDAGAAVVMARDWQAESSKEHALLGRHVDVNMSIPTDEQGLQCGVSISEADASHIESVEHVVVYITTNGHDVRGELEIVLTSPAGTQSIMAWATSDGKSISGPTDYENFKFMTVKNWGETAAGTWALQVKDKRQNENEGNLVSWLLAIYGKCGGSASGDACKKVVSPIVCTEECQWSNDGACDDGGQNGELTQYCAFGTDCIDCGARYPQALTFQTSGGITLSEGSASCAVVTTTVTTTVATTTNAATTVTTTEAATTTTTPPSTTTAAPPSSTDASSSPTTTTAAATTSTTLDGGAGTGQTTQTPTVSDSTTATTNTSTTSEVAPVTSIVDEGNVSAAMRTDGGSDVAKGLAVAVLLLTRALW